MFKFMGKLVLFFTLLIVMAVAAIIFFPQVLINENTLRHAAAFAYHYGIGLRWSDLEVEVTSPSFLRRNFTFQFNDLCIESSTFSGCFPVVMTTLEIDWRRARQPLVAVGPTRVVGKHLSWHPTPAADKPETEKPGIREWQTFISSISWRPADVKVERFVWKTPEKKRIARKIALKLEETGPQEWQLKVNASKLQGYPVRQLAGNATLHFTSEVAPSIANAEAHVHARAPWGNIAIKGFFDRPAPSRNTLRIEALVTRGEEMANLLATATRDNENWRGEISGSALNMVPYIGSIAIKDCTFSGQLPVALSKTFTLKGQCPVRLSNPDIPLASRWRKQLPQQATLILQPDIEFKQWRQGTYDANLQARLEPINHPLAKISLNAKLNASGNLFQGLRPSEIRSEANTDVQIPEFSRIVEVLYNSRWAIPAPFHVFGGPIGCSGQGSFTLKGGHFPITCQTRLSSPTQKLFLTADGRFDLTASRQEWQRHLDLRLLVEDAILALPRWELRSPIPQLFPDPRIGKSLEEAIDQPGFTYQLKIATARGRPLHLLTNLATEPVPIVVNGLTLEAGEGLKGEIIVQSFDLRPLKQEAEVNQIALQFPGSKQPPEIKGEMTFRSVDYLIKLAIAGTVKKPRFQIFSVPPRPENELISNVFFGGEFEELDEGQMRSVEETRAALADGAISIMSMYYLAATPIESVGFNPHTGVFRAKIKLGRDLSLTVGSDMHQTQTVGLRKRLSPNWSVETTVRKEAGTEEQTERAMLRWARRY